MSTPADALLRASKDLALLLLDLRNLLTVSLPDGQRQRISYVVDVLDEGAGMLEHALLVQRVVERTPDHAQG